MFPLSTKEIRIRKSRLACERGGRCFRWLPPPLPGLVPVTWWHTSPLANMPRRRDKVPRRRRYIAPSPPAPIISLRLACADADRCESERPCDSCSRGDPLQFHRDSYISWLPRRYQGRWLAAHCRKRQGAHDYFAMCTSSHLPRSLATTDPPRPVFACAASLFG